MGRSKTGFLVVISLALFGLSGPAKAALINGDFQDFAGWDGVIVDSFTLTPAVIDPAADPAHFGPVPGGLANLRNDFDFFEVALQQTFVVDPGASTLAFDVGWSLTDSFDFLQASILDPGTGGLLLDLFAGLDTTLTEQALARAAVDISALAGQAVVIEFLLQDGDFNEADVLTIGNIALEGLPVGVPEPSGLYTLLLGLLALGAKRRLRRANLRLI